MQQEFIADNIMQDGPEGLTLIGGQCGSCQHVAFPRPAGCAQCGGEEITDLPLSRTGTLWTWTTQSFPVKRPYLGAADAGTFQPYALGYVELAEGLRVESRILTEDLTGLRIGQSVRLEAAPLVEVDGVELLMFAFRPIEEVAA